MSLHLQARQVRPGPLRPRGSPKKPSSQSSQRFPGGGGNRGQNQELSALGATPGTHLWFLQDSWCRPPLCSSGPQRRWLQPGRDKADSPLLSHHWRRRRNRLCSAHSSSRPCCPDSRRLLDRQTVSGQTVRQEAGRRDGVGGTCVWAAGGTVAVAAAGLAGAEGAQRRLRAAVSHGAALTVLPLVTLGTAALLHPAGGNSGSTPGRHQGDVVQVTSTCRGRRG